VLFEREQAREEEANKARLKHAAENVQSVARTGSTRRQTGSQAERKKILDDMMKQKQRTTNKRARSTSSRRERVGEDSDDEEESDDEDADRSDEEYVDDHVDNADGAGSDKARLASSRAQRQGSKRSRKHLRKGDDDNEERIDDEQEEDERGGHGSDIDAEVSYEEFKRICMSRSKLGTWANAMHKLKETFTGMYVKFDATPEQQSGVNYRLGQILDWYQASAKKAYKIPTDDSSAATETTTYMRLQRDSGIIFTFPIKFVSNKTPTEEEFSKFMSKIKESNEKIAGGELSTSGLSNEAREKISVPTRRDMLSAEKRLKKLASFRWTEADIKKKVLSSGTGVVTSGRERERLRMEERKLEEQLEEQRDVLDEKARKQLENELERTRGLRMKVEHGLERREERKRQIVSGSLTGIESTGAKSKGRSGRDFLNSSGSKRLSTSTGADGGSSATGGRATAQHSAQAPVKPRTKEPSAEKGLTITATAAAAAQRGQSGDGNPDAAIDAGKEDAAVNRADAEAEQSEKARRRADEAYKDRTDELMQACKQVWESQAASMMQHPLTGEQLSINDAAAGKYNDNLVQWRPKAQLPSEMSEVDERVHEMLKPWLVT
jgi:hypothetical protein